MTKTDLKNLVASVNALHGAHDNHLITGKDADGLHVSCSCGVDLKIKVPEMPHRRKPFIPIPSEEADG